MYWLLFLFVNLISCGTLLRRIVGGIEAPTFKYLFLVSLNAIDSNGNMNHICGGTLLSRDLVLTAAHCGYNMSNGTLYRIKDLRVLVHRHDLTLPSELEGGAELHVSKVLRHPSFNLYRAVHDIAIWKLAPSIPMDIEVDFMDLDFGLELSEGERAIAVGYGKTQSSKGLPNKLHVASMPIANFNFCKSKYYNRYYHAFRIQPEYQLCAGSAKSNGNVCLGDSGGPLFVEKYGQLIQVGITSFTFSSDCDVKEAPSVFTKIKGYSNFILPILSDSY